MADLASDYADQEESKLPWVQFATVQDIFQTPKRSRTASPGSSISSGRGSTTMSNMGDRQMDVLHVDVGSLSTVIRAQLVFFVEKLKKIQDVTVQEQLLDEAVDLVKQIEKQKTAK